MCLQAPAPLPPGSPPTAAPLASTLAVDGDGTAGATAPMLQGRTSPSKGESSARSLLAQLTAAGGNKATPPGPQQRVSLDSSALGIPGSFSSGRPHAPPPPPPPLPLLSPPPPAAPPQGELATQVSLLGPLLAAGRSTASKSAAVPVPVPHADLSPALPESVQPAGANQNIPQRRVGPHADLSNTLPESVQPARKHQQRGGPQQVDNLARSLDEKSFSRHAGQRPQSKGKGRGLKLLGSAARRAAVKRFLVTLAEDEEMLDRIGAHLEASGWRQGD
jgi:hypothetical protein